jgi:hypothetical protein
MHTWATGNGAQSSRTDVRVNGENLCMSRGRVWINFSADISHAVEVRHGDRQRSPPHPVRIHGSGTWSRLALAGLDAFLAKLDDPLAGLDVDDTRFAGMDFSSSLWDASLDSLNAGNLYS